MEATADIRYSFAPQFLEAAAIFAQCAAKIEKEVGDSAGSKDRVRHRGYVVSTIMQCVAALETQLYDVTTYGPGAHLGSNSTDKKARDFLRPCADMIDSQPGIVLRYETVLHLLQKPKPSRGIHPYQNTKLLVTLRNELVHYKSKWGNEMKNKNWQKALRNLNHQKPPFISDHSNFFPHLCLNADCAAWSVRTAVAFLDDFYCRLGLMSPLEPYRSRLEV